MLNEGKILSKVIVVMNLKKHGVKLDAVVLVYIMYKYEMYLDF